MHDKRDLLREDTADDDRNAIHPRTLGKTRQLRLDQISKRHPARVSRDHEILRAGECLQPAEDGHTRALDVATARQRIGHDRLHDGEQVLGPVLQLAYQHELPSFRLLSFGDIAGYSVNADRLAVLAEHQARIDFERQLPLAALLKYPDLVVG